MGGETCIRHFNSVYFVDFEFGSGPGERQKPICLVALDLVSGKLIRVWEDDLNKMDSPPFPIGEDSLYVAYYASAEIHCHLALGWEVPVNILDLFTEFRCMTNGRYVPSGSGLIGAMIYFGLTVMDAVDKTAMRDLALRGGPWADGEEEALLDYCESDVQALKKLLPAMLPGIDLPRALIRGRYMAAVAHMEYAGVPIDTPRLTILRDRWTDIQDLLIAEVDKGFGIYDGRTFKAYRFEAYLSRNNIPWPRLESGALDMRDSTFKDMAIIYPAIQPLRELRVTLSKMRLSDLAVGSDGRNRCMLSAYRSKTGRNQPSNSQYIFGPSAWLRSLIRPEPGCGMAYIDWSQQEFANAAALSGDELMMEAYLSGDPYMQFAIQAGLAPAGATKQTHKQERTLCKACVLAVQYGMGEKSLAQRINRPEIEARGLLNLHKQTYKKYWDWSDGVLDYAMLHGKLWTVFGWELHVSTLSDNPRSLRNFLMQANGAEMLRLACIYLTENGIKAIAPVHDAVLIEAPLERLDQDIATAQYWMQKAGEVVLGGFKVRSDAEIVRFPDRYMDGRGGEMWNKVWEIVNGMDREPSH
jgi:DNA polymerase I